MFLLITCDQQNKFLYIYTIVEKYRELFILCFYLICNCYSHNYFHLPLDISKRIMVITKDGVSPISISPFHLIKVLFISKIELLNEYG